MRLGSLRSSSPERVLAACVTPRMINRAPGLKIVLNALFAAIPDVLNVAAVCFMFFLIFAILGVNYFKGVLMSCQGDGFNSLEPEVASFLEDPLAWDDMSDQQRAWFSPLSNVSAAFSVDDNGGFTTASDCADINDWPDYAGCCSEWPAISTQAPTSLQVSESTVCGWFLALLRGCGNTEIPHSHEFLMPHLEARVARSIFQSR